MREIIPLKKDIIFKTKIGEITNINLDHNYKIKDSIIEGNVILSGSYKMTEASVLEEDFQYKIPFSIAISRMIKEDTINIEIDDFKYNINKDVFSVNIELELTCEEEVIEEEIPILDNNTIIENSIDEEVLNNIHEEEKTINVDDSINNITSTIINNENNYYTYKVYIVREGDSIDTICSKYNINIDDLKEYNEINELNVGDKIIIPSINE